MSLDYWAWGLVIAGVFVAGIEAVTFFRFSTVITSAMDLNASSIGLTGAIGGFIGGTAGLFISMASVMFFISALKSQRVDINKNHQPERSRQIEQTFFNLLENLIKIKERVYQQAALFNEERWGISNPNHYQPPKRYATRPDFESLYSVLRSYQKFYSEDSLANLFIKDSFEMENGKLVSNFPGCGKWEEMAERFYHIDLETLKENPVKEAYKLFYLEFERIYGHYFRALSQLLKFLKNKEEEDLDESSIDKNQVHQRYLEFSTFVSSQMSTDELGLFFYDSINSPARLKIIKHYHFMANFNSRDLLDERDRLLYN